MIPHPLSMVHIFPEEAVTTAEAVCFLVLFGVSKYEEYKEKEVDANPWDLP